jgi:hypothetical protein
MAWGFRQAYCDEAYAVLSKDWLDAQGLDPEGFSLSDLQSDMEDATGVAMKRAAG